MKHEIVILGAGGHTRSLIPLIRLNGYSISAIYDDSFKNGIEALHGPQLTLVNCIIDTLLCKSVKENGNLSAVCKVQSGASLSTSLFFILFPLPILYD